MPPICWGAADTEGSGSGGALPPGRGVGRGAEEGGLVSGRGPQRRESFVGGGRAEETELDFEKKDRKGGLRWRFESDQWQKGRRGAGRSVEIEDRKRIGTEKKWVKMAKEKGQEHSIN